MFKSFWSQPKLAFLLRSKRNNFHVALFLFEQSDFSEDQILGEFWFCFVALQVLSCIACFHSCFFKMTLCPVSSLSSCSMPACHSSSGFKLGLPSLFPYCFITFHLQLLVLSRLNLTWIRFMVSLWKRDRLSTKLMAISVCLGCDLHVDFGKKKQICNKCEW